MNLYVFRLVGKYIGGAMGVVADTPEEALRFAEERRRACHQRIDSGDYKTPFRGVGSEYRNEPVFLTPKDAEKARLKGDDGPNDWADHFLLAHVLPLGAGVEPGVVFCEGHAE